MKCLVLGCDNHKGEGNFIGELCAPCYQMLTTGRAFYGNTFVHKLQQDSTKLDTARLAILNFIQGI